MECGIVTSKTVLLLISLIFWAAGAALAYVGAYVIKSYNNFEHFLEDKYTLIPAVIIIGIAVVMFIIGLVGCCATLRESKFGLSFFFLIILVIFAAEVAAFVCGYIYRGRIKGDLENSMTTVFNQYDGENSESRAVDLLQTEGCEPKLETLFQDVLKYAILVILGFAIIKLFGLISVCVIACRSRRNDYQQFYA